MSRSVGTDRPSPEHQTDPATAGPEPLGAPRLLTCPENRGSIGRMSFTFPWPCGYSAEPELVPCEAGTVPGQPTIVLRERARTAPASAPDARSRTESFLPATPPRAPPSPGSPPPLRHPLATTQDSGLGDPHPHGYGTLAVLTAPVGSSVVRIRRASSWATAQR
jgi:hypothetical protein